MDEDQENDEGRKLSKKSKKLKYDKEGQGRGSRERSNDSDLIQMVKESVRKSAVSSTSQPAPESYPANSKNASYTEDNQFTIFDLDTDAPPTESETAVNSSVVPTLVPSKFEIIQENHDDQIKLEEEEVVPEMDSPKSETVIVTQEIEIVEEPEPEVQEERPPEPVPEPEPEVKETLPDPEPEPEVEEERPPEVKLKKIKTSQGTMTGQCQLETPVTPYSLILDILTSYEELPCNECDKCDGGCSQEPFFVQAVLSFMNDLIQRIIDRVVS